jgi:hypothetical protein
VPEEQTLHEVRPALAWNCPPAQLLQLGRPVSGWNKPALQLEHLADADAAE